MWWRIVVALGWLLQCAHGYCGAVLTVVFHPSETKKICKCHTCSTSKALPNRDWPREDDQIENIHHVLGGLKGCEKHKTFQPPSTTSGNIQSESYGFYMIIMNKFCMSTLTSVYYVYNIINSVNVIKPFIFICKYLSQKNYEGYHQPWKRVNSPASEWKAEGTAWHGGPQRWEH